MPQKPHTHSSGNGDDPLSGLRSLAAERAKLARANAGLDREQAALVRRARNAGCGWQMIAGALGVTRQAVHKKYGRS